MPATRRGSGLCDSPATQSTRNTGDENVRIPSELPSAERCSTRTDLKIHLRFDRAVGCSQIAKYMGEISEDDCAAAVLEYIDSALKAATDTERVSATSQILSVRRSQDVSLLESLVSEEGNRSALATLLIDPPKEAKKLKVRDEEKEGGQLTSWTGTERRPSLGGHLRVALLDGNFRFFSSGLLQTRFGRFFESVFQEAGKGISPSICQESEAISVSANHFLLELAALFLAFNANSDQANTGKCVQACRENVGLLPKADRIILPPSVLSVNGKQKHHNFYKSQNGLLEESSRLKRFTFRGDRNAKFSRGHASGQGNVRRSDHAASENTAKAQKEN